MELGNPAGGLVERVKLTKAARPGIAPRRFAVLLLPVHRFSKRGVSAGSLLAGVHDSSQPRRSRRRCDPEQRRRGSRRRMCRRCCGRSRSGHPELMLERLLLAPLLKPAQHAGIDAGQSRVSWFLPSGRNPARAALLPAARSGFSVLASCAFRFLPGGFAVPPAHHRWRVCINSRAALNSRTCSRRSSFDLSVKRCRFCAINSRR